MTNNKIRRKIRKLAIKHYDKMISEARHVAKDYKTERVPIFYIKQIIERSKLKEPINDEDLENFRLKFNDVQNKLKKVCIKHSKTLKDDKIALNHFKMFIDEIKSGFLRGIDNPQKVEQ